MWWVFMPAKGRIKGSEDDPGRLVESTVGRFIFNQNIPQDLGFCGQNSGSVQPGSRFPVR